MNFSTVLWIKFYHECSCVMYAFYAYVMSKYVWMTLGLAIAFLFSCIFSLNIVSHYCDIVLLWCMSQISHISSQDQCVCAVYYFMLCFTTYSSFSTLVWARTTRIEHKPSTSTYWPVKWYMTSCRTTARHGWATSFRVPEIHFRQS